MGVMAGTLRTVVGRALALGGAATTCGVLAAVLAARVADLAPRGGAQADDLVELAVLAGGVLVLLWLAGSAAVAAVCLAARSAGLAWCGGEAWVRRFAPGMVRRALVLVVAAGIGAASVAPASAGPVLAPPTSSAPTATTSAADGAGLDLGWVVTDGAPGAGTPRPAAAPTPAHEDEPPASSGTAVAATTPPPTAPLPGATWLSPSRAPLDTQPVTVVVVRGDTLWDIAARHLGPAATPAQIAAAWPAWYAANAATIGPDPGLIRPGQVLLVPAEVGR